MLSSKINQKIVEIEKALNNRTRMTYENFQPWSVFDNVKVGDVLLINNTKNKCAVKESKRMEFETLIPPGAGFPEHWHDFIENLTILSGTYTDVTSGLVVPSGETVHYEPGDVHQPENHHKDNLLIEVIFTR